MSIEPQAAVAKETILSERGGRVHRASDRHYCVEPRHLDRVSGHVFPGAGGAARSAVLCPRLIVPLPDWLRNPWESFTLGIVSTVRSMCKKKIHHVVSVCLCTRC